ncbi:MAG: hypothetical protein ACPLSY_03750 [Moorellaceae bacterium]
MDLTINSHNLENFNVPTNNGIWFEDDEGNRQCICPVSIEVTAIEIDYERDRYWYVARIGEPINREVRSPVYEGGEGIVRAVTQAGVWVDRKKLGQHFDKILSARWMELIQNARPYTEAESGIDPEAISIYEKFWEWIDTYRKEFEEGHWGIIIHTEEEIKVIIYVAAFAKFFADVRIRSEAERRAVLRYWKNKNWLRPNGNDRFSALYRDPLLEKVRRVYIIVFPKDKFEKN